MLSGVSRVWQGDTGSRGMEWHLTSEGGSGGLPGGSAAEVGPAGEQGLVGREAPQAGVGSGREWGLTTRASLESPGEGAGRKAAPFRTPAVTLSLRFTCIFSTDKPFSFFKVQKAQKPTQHASCPQCPQPPPRGKRAPNPSCTLPGVARPF